MRISTLQTELWLPRAIDAIFAFFSDPYNLDTLTPPWLHFRILTPRDVVLGQGSLIDYRLRWRGIPLRWRTEISDWEPPHRFVDRQVRGPYRLWVHEHTFTPGDGGTFVRDRVEYAIPGWICAPLLSRVVTPDVQRIFAFRQERMKELFGSQKSVADQTR